MKRRQPEKAEQAAIIKLLCTVGCQVYPLGTHRRRGDYQGTMQAPGLPDVLAFLPRGMGMLAIEVKAPGGRLSPEQEQFGDQCLACEEPFLVHYVTGGLDDVIEYLIALGLLKPENVAWYRAPKGSRWQTRATSQPCGLDTVKAALLKVPDLVDRAEQAESALAAARAEGEAGLEIIRSAFGYTVGGPSLPDEIATAILSLREELDTAELEFAALREQRCEGRYPVPQTSPPRDEPFEVTYRCALPKGHDGPHGAWARREP